MKKILSLLAGLGLTATAGSSLVACQTSDLIANNQVETARVSGIEELNKQFADNKSSIEQLQDHLSFLKNNYANGMRQLTDHQENIDKVSWSINSIKTSSKEFPIREAKLEQEISNLENQITKFKQPDQELIDKKEAIQKQLDEYEKEIKQVSQAIDEETRKWQNLLEEKKAISIQIDMAKDEETRNNLSNQKQKITDDMNRSAEIKMSLENKEEGLFEVGNNLINQKSLISKRIDRNIEGKLMKHYDQIEELRSQLSSSRSELSSIQLLKEELNELVIQLPYLEAIKSGLNYQSKNAQEYLKNISEEIQQDEQQLVELEIKQEDLQARILHEHSLGNY